jgi:hypothetical protein
MLVKKTAYIDQRKEQKGGNFPFKDNMKLGQIIFVTSCDLPLWRRFHSEKSFNINVKVYRWGIVI